MEVNLRNKCLLFLGAMPAIGYWTNDFFTNKNIQMEPTRNKLEDIIEHIENFGKTTIELSKLKSLETTARLAPLALSRMCVVRTFSFFTFFFNIGIALYLCDLLENNYIGFFIVSGLYLMIGVIFHFFLHGWIKKPTAELIIKQILR